MRVDVLKIILVTDIPVSWWCDVYMCGQKGLAGICNHSAFWTYVFLICQWQFDMMWPFKVWDYAYLVHQGLTQSSYSINICSVNEEPFNSSEHIPLQSNKLKPFWNQFCFLISSHLRCKESEHTEGTLYKVKVSQWLQSLRLNVIFFSSCLLEFRVLSFNSVFPQEAERTREENVKRLSLFMSYFWCCREPGLNLNFLWSSEPSKLLVFNPTIFLPA